MSKEPKSKFDSERIHRWRSLQSELKPTFIETLDTIEKAGWQTWSVFSNKEDEPNFFYTVGAHDIFGMPELITIGLPVEVGGNTLNYAVNLMRKGQDLTNGRIHGVLGGPIEVEFHPVHSKWLHRIMLRTHWYYEGEDIPVLQLIFPDLDNRFQWEEDFNDFFAQPMLAPGYPEQDQEKEFWDSHDPNFDKTAWKFSQPPSKKVMSTESVETQKEPITYVAHQEDGEWMFLGPQMIDGVPYTSRLRRIVASDKSIEKLADLPLGWVAVRDSPDKPWERFEDKDEEIDA